MTTQIQNRRGHLLVITRMKRHEQVTATNTTEIHHEQTIEDEGIDAARPREGQEDEKAFCEQEESQEAVQPSKLWTRNSITAPFHAAHRDRLATI